MKKSLEILLIVSVLLSCKNSKNNQASESLKTVMQVSLPFKDKCKFFFKWDNKKRIFENKDTIWQLNSKSPFQIIIKNQKKIARPILVSQSVNGIIIDSLYLFDRECYIGTDSDYQPWLEINENLEILWIDTLYHKSKDEIHSKGNTIFLKIDTLINKKIYQVEANGKIKTVANIK